jgi:ABC-type multidrug transport system ATPase subunit
MAPQIMFLDEPELAIDSDSLRNLIDILLRLKSEGVGVVILTHDIDNFVPIADHLIIMNEGKVLAEGNPKKILTKEFVEKTNMRLPALWNMWKKLPCKTWDELSKVVDVCTGAL